MFDNRVMNEIPLLILAHTHTHTGVAIRSTTQFFTMLDELVELSDDDGDDDEEAEGSSEAAPATNRL